MKIATSKKPTAASKQSDVKKNSKPEKPVKKFDDDDDDDMDLEPDDDDFNEGLNFDEDDEDDDY